MAITLSSHSSLAKLQRRLQKYQSRIRKSTQRLSSGRRINSASDDTQRSARSSKINIKIDSGRQVQKATSQATTFMDVASQSLMQMSDALTVLRTLSVQGGGGNKTKTKEQK